MIRKTTIAAFTSLLLGTAARATLPSVITYNGYLLDGSGAPVTTSTTLVFNFYSEPTGGTPLNAAPFSVIVLPSVNGYFSAVIDLGQDTNVFDDGPRYMALAAAGEAEMSPRIQLTSAPFAVSARSVSWSGVSGFPASSCSGATPIATGIAANGAVECGAVPGPAGGTVTSVGATAGGGLVVTGEPTTTPSVGLITTCSAGQVLKWSGSAWGCEADATGIGTTYSAAVGQGLSLSGTAFGLQACPADQVLKSAGTTWACAADAASAGTVTSITAGAGLTGGTITTSGTLAVSFGDSGSATTASRSDHAHAIRVPVALADLTPAGSVTAGNVVSNFANPRAWLVPAGNLQVAVSGTVIVPVASSPSLRVTVHNPGATSETYGFYVGTSAIIRGQPLPDTRWSSSPVTVTVPAGQTAVMTRAVGLLLAHTSCIPSCPSAGAGDLLWFSFGLSGGVAHPAYNILGVEFVF